MKRLILAIAALLLVGVAVAATTASTSQSILPTVEVTLKEHTVKAEVAKSMIETQRGLMWRNELGTDQGMLFVFEKDEPRSFWMKNTLIPLDIAFINKDKKILNIHQMAPNNSTRHYRSAGPARYALEVNQGWFKEHGIGAGDVVEFDLSTMSP